LLKSRVQSESIRSLRTTGLYTWPPDFQS